MLMESLNFVYRILFTHISSNFFWSIFHFLLWPCAYWIDTMGLHSVLQMSPAQLSLLYEKLRQEIIHTGGSRKGSKASSALFCVTTGRYKTFRLPFHIIDQWRTRKLYRWSSVKEDRASTTERVTSGEHKEEKIVSPTDGVPDGLQKRGPHTKSSVYGDSWLFVTFRSNLMLCSLLKCTELNILEQQTAAQASAEGWF